MKDGFRLQLLTYQKKKKKKRRKKPPAKKNRKGERKKEPKVNQQKIKDYNRFFFFLLLKLRKTVGSKKRKEKKGEKGVEKGKIKYHNIFLKRQKRGQKERGKKNIDKKTSKKKTSELRRHINDTTRSLPPQAHQPKFPFFFLLQTLPLTASPAVLQFYFFPERFLGGRDLSLPGGDDFI